MSMIAWFLALAGFSCLALAMAEHHHWLTGRDPSPQARRLLRQAGALLLAGSWLSACAAWGIAMGSIAWCAVLTFAAAPLVLARTYLNPRRRRTVTRG
jgi:hypothetical protein